MHFCQPSKSSLISTVTLILSVTLGWQNALLPSVNSVSSGFFKKKLLLHLTHLASVDVVKDKVQFVRRLEGVVEADQERVLDVLEKHVPLRHDVLYFVTLHDRLLLQHLDRVHPALILVAGQQHL